MKPKKKIVKKKTAELPAVKVVLKRSPRSRAKAAAETTAAPANSAKTKKPRKPVTVSKAAPTKSLAAKASPKAAARKVPARKLSAAKPGPGKAKLKTAAPRAQVARKAVAEAVSVTPVAATAVREVSKTFSASPKPPTRKAPERIPAILFEGDKAEPASVSGPGQRYSLGPLPPAEKFAVENELPAAYGTQRLFLAARDPHWLYAHWDLTDDQLRNCNARSIDQHLLLRVHEERLATPPVQEIHLHPDSRHWFLHVDRAGVKYIAELGCYISRGKWVTVAASSPTLTPPDTVSTDNTAEFATIPFEVPMAKLLSLVKDAVQENVPLAQALREVRAAEFPTVPELPLPPGETRRAAAQGKPKESPAAVASEWTAEQEEALAKIISMDHVRRVWMGSLEITELIRRQALQKILGEAALLGPAGGAPTSPSRAPGMAGGISSPSGREQPEKGFWFNVNAELIIYGATEADAIVTIAGRKIRLRPDGSFSYRFALPDGNYELPVVAVSADRTDGRAAELAFSRSTGLRGEVGTHPQDSELKRPEAINL
jgi:hypothetical protein